jgi:hypothetical protein
VGGLASFYKLSSVNIFIHILDNVHIHTYCTLYCTVRRTVYTYHTIHLRSCTYSTYDVQNIYAMYSLATLESYV